jgi:hypothetical protein
VEIVPCARNKWGIWWDFWFYVALGDVEGLLSLPSAILCSHCYVAFPRFEVAEEDEDEGALRHAARLSSGRDLVEEFIAYGVWPLGHGVILDEVTPRWMPTLGGQLVRSPAFVVDLRGRNATAFVREVEAKVAKIVGKYVPKMETLRSWDIRGSNVMLNCVFELNRLSYVGYPGDDYADVAVRRGKHAMPTADKGPSRDKALGAVIKERKLGTTTEGLRAFNHFVVDLLETCVVPGETMSSPELQESSARMLEVTRGHWPRNVPIPRAAGEDMFTSQLARELKIFPYKQNVGAVVSTVMEKDRPDAPRKRRAFARLADPRREAKMARPCTKPAAPGSSMPPPTAPTHERRPPSPPRAAEAMVAVTEVSMELSVGDYLVSGVTMFDAHTRLAPTGEFLIFLRSSRLLT